MASVAEHEKRSQEIGDTLRGFLIAINTGGIGALLAVAASLAEKQVSPGWTFVPLVFFVLGLVAVAGSLFLAKHRELVRRDAAANGTTQPSFRGLGWRSTTWDGVALICFVLGAIIGLYELSQIRVPMPPNNALQLTKPAQAMELRS